MNNLEFHHVILVSIDTLRADCIAASPLAYSFLNKYQINNKLDTKVLDDILNNSLYFNHCFSAAPYTGASHASCFTGFWPLHHGVYEFFNRKLTKKTLFEYAKENGYETIFQTDFPVILGDFLGFTKAIDFYYIEDEHAAIKKLLEDNNKKTFSFFHFGGVHLPYGFHTKKFGGNDYIYKIEELEKKYLPNSSDKLKDILDETFRNSIDKDLLFRYKAIIEYMYLEGLYNELFSLYIEGINYFINTRFRDFIERLRSFVDANSDALMLIFSDHGEQWDEETYGHYNNVSEEILHVPLLFYGNGIKQQIVNDLVSLVDVPSTLLRLMGGNQGQINTDGSFLSLFDKSESKKEQKRHVIAQTWLTKDIQQLSEYQKKASKGLSRMPFLNTFLYKELCYDGEHLLINKYTQDTKLSQRIFLKKIDDYQYVESTEGIVQKIFVENLRQYNKLSSDGNQIAVTNEIREQLLALGYRI